MFSRLTILLATGLSCANSCHYGTSFPNTNPSKYFSISTCGSSCETVRQNQFNSVLRFDTNFFNSLIFVNSYIYIYSSSSVSFLINHPQLLCPLLRYLNLLLSSSSVLSSLSSLILRSLKPTRLLLDRRSLSAVIRRSQWQKHVSNFNYKFLTLQRSKGRINQPTIQLFFLDKIFDFKFKPMFR